MTSTPGAAENLQTTNLLKQLSQRLPERGRTGRDTLAEERQEVLTGVLDSLRWGTGDPEARTACRRLLRHLLSTPRQG